MKIENVITPTGVARPGMTVREGFKLCLQAGVPGIPFVNQAGQVAGIFSIRETLRRACIPEIMVNYADLLGDTTSCVEIPDEHARQLLGITLDGFVREEHVDVALDTTLVKVVALMEKHSINYVFVHDDGNYIGVITIWAIARRMLELF